MRLDELRVLQVVPTLLVGGLERVATVLALGLDGRVERIVVATSGGEPFERVLREAGVPLVFVPRPRPRVGALAQAAPALARVIRRERPHVLHAHNPAAAIAAGIARRLALRPGLPIVTTYHGVMSHRLGRAVRAMALSSDLVVGVGPETTRSLNDAGLSPSRTTTVYNAVDAHVDRSRAEVRRELDVEDAELLVTVGRYAPEKDHALLLDAIARLAPTRPRLRALVIGGGPLEEALRRRVDELGLHAVVQLLGSREDAVAIAAAADVFALSSESEGLPLALLEAMVVGTAVVSTAVGGVGDAIRDGETGLLVPHGDPDALAAAVERLLDDERLRQRLVAAAREHVGERASPQAMIDRYAAIYLALAERRSPNAS